MPGPMRDSLSRCHTNPYSLQEMKQTTKPVITPTSRPDTLEISREKLQKEALGRLRHTTKQTIAHNGFMRIGKVLFMAVAIPPYIVLFGIPKWVLVVALPSTVTLLSIVSQKVQKKLKQKIQKVVRFIQVVIQKGQNQLKVLVQPLVRLALEIRNQIQQLRERVVVFSNYVINAFNKPLEKLKKGSAKLKTLGHHSQKFMQRILAGVTTPIPALMEKAQQLGQSIVTRLKGISLPKINWDRSEKIASAASQKVEYFFKASQAKIQTVTKQISIVLQKITQPIGLFYKKIEDFVTDKYAKVENFLRKTTSYLKNLKDRYRFSESIAFQGMPKKWRQHLNQPIIRQTIEKGVRGFYSLLILFTQAIEWLFKLVGQVVKAVVKSVQGAFKVIQKISLIFVEQAVTVMALIGKYFRIGLYHFLLWSIMASILFVWGIRSINHYATRTFFKA